MCVAQTHVLASVRGWCVPRVFARARSAAVLRFGKHMHASTTTTATVSEESRESEEEDTRNALAHCRCHIPRVTCPILA